MRLEKTWFKHVHESFSHETEFHQRQGNDATFIQTIDQMLTQINNYS